jgi:CRP-like cAMP-binding protein
MLQSCIFIEKIMDYQLLLKSPLFRGLSVEDTEAILNNTPHRTRKFPEGKLIAQSGEPVDRLMIVLSGTVKGEMVDFTGRIIKIEDIPAPGALAAAFMFGSKNGFPVNVISLKKTELLVIEKEDFLRLLKTNDRILINFLDMISNRSQFLSEKIKFLNFKTIKGKLAHYILQRSGEGSNSIVMDKTQNDLADYFGVARPSVARALGDLEDEGYLIAERRKITILDKQGLSDLTID